MVEAFTVIALLVIALPVKAFGIITGLIETFFVKARLIKPFPVETFPVKAGLIKSFFIKTLRIETGLIEAFRIEALGIKTVPIKTPRIESIFVEAIFVKAVFIETILVISLRIITIPVIIRTVPAFAVKSLFIITGLVITFLVITVFVEAFSIKALLIETFSVETLRIKASLIKAFLVEALCIVASLIKAFLVEALCIVAGLIETIPVIAVTIKACLIESFFVKTFGIKSILVEGSFRTVSRFCPGAVFQGTGVTKDFRISAVRIQVFRRFSNGRSVTTSRNGKMLSTRFPFSSIKSLLLHYIGFHLKVCFITYKSAGLCFGLNKYLRLTGSSSSGAFKHIVGVNTDDRFSSCFPDINGLLIHVNGIDKYLRSRITDERLRLHEQAGFPFCLYIHALICWSCLYGTALIHIRGINKDLFSAPASKLAGSLHHPRATAAGSWDPTCSGQ